MVEVVELADDALLGRICKRLRKSAVSVLGGYLLAEFTQLTLFPRWSCSILITAWEQRKLGELYSLVSEKNDLTFGRESIISVANMYFNANVNVADEQYLRTYNVMRLGDIAFEGHSNKEFSHGRFVENYIGDGIVSHIFTVLRPRVPFDVNYWRYAINNEKLMRLSLIRSTKASTMMHDLVPSDFLREAIPTPTLAEQKEIGAFLVGLDHLITLHQRKHDKLVQLKKSMLDKMFPKPGETEPEIRFVGFTDPWEQRKLGELCTFSKGHGYSKADIRDAGTPLILYGRLYTQYESRIEEVDTFAVGQDGSMLSRGNEVIVPASGETAEDIAVASSVRRSGIILGGDLNVVTPTSKLDPDYTALAITYSKAHDDLAKRAQGKSVVHVHGNDIAEVEVSYPSESEQKRISSVVLNLDSLITLHQREPGFTDMGYMRVERALMTMSMSLFSSS
jgi:type I restriction enzyme S subunit